MAVCTTNGGTIAIMRRSGETSGPNLRPFHLRSSRRVWRIPAGLLRSNPHQAGTQPVFVEHPQGAYHQSGSGQVSGPPARAIPLKPSLRALHGSRRPGVVAVTAITGIFYLVIVALGGFFMVRARSAQALSSGDLLACRLLAGFALFFVGFDVTGVIGLFIRGEWVNFANAGLVAAALALAGYAWARRRGSREAVGKSEPLFSVPAFNGTTRFVAIVVGAGFLLVSGLLVIGFPRGFEANAYHLPSAVNFFCGGTLHVWDTTWLHTLPGNASLWDGFWLRLLPERAVSLVNLPFLALCVFILYRLCRYSGADPSAAGLVSLGITTIPLFGFCATELGADVAGVAFALLAFWLALSRPAVMPSWPVLAGAASGIAYGFKPPHLVTAILVGLLVLVGRAPAGMRATPRARIVHLSCLVAGFIALAGVWLLRNQVELGNPFYPIPLGGLPELAGFTPARDWPFDEFKNSEFEWVPATWQWLIYPWVEGHKFHQNFKFSSGLGPFFAATAPPAWIAFGIMLLLDLRRRVRAEPWRPFNPRLYVCGTLIFLLGGCRARAAAICAGWNCRADASGSGPARQFVWLAAARIRAHFEYRYPLHAYGPPCLCRRRAGFAPDPWAPPHNGGSFRVSAAHRRSARGFRHRRFAGSPASLRTLRRQAHQPGGQLP